MAKLEKNLPMAFVFYGQDTLMENNKTYDEIGIFLPNSHFFKKSGTSCGEGGGDSLWLIKKVW